MKQLTLAFLLMGVLAVGGGGDAVGATSPVVCTVQALDGTTWQAADVMGRGTITVTNGAFNVEF